MNNNYCRMDVVCLTRSKAVFEGVVRARGVSKNGGVGVAI